MGDYISTIFPTLEQRLNQTLNCASSMTAPKPPLHEQLRRAFSLGALNQRLYGYLNDFDAPEQSHNEMERRAVTEYPTPHTLEFRLVDTGIAYPYRSDGTTLYIFVKNGDTLAGVYATSAARARQHLGPYRAEKMWIGRPLTEYSGVSEGPLNKLRIDFAFIRELNFLLDNPSELVSTGA